MDDEEERCWSRGNQIADYSRCIHALDHDDEHEDEEGHRWFS